MAVAIGVGDAEVGVRAIAEALGDRAYYVMLNKPETKKLLAAKIRQHWPSVIENLVSNGFIKREDLSR